MYMKFFAAFSEFQKLEVGEDKVSSNELEYSEATGVSKKSFALKIENKSWIIFTHLKLGVKGEILNVGSQGTWLSE